MSNNSRLMTLIRNVQYIASGHLHERVKNKITVEAIIKVIEKLLEEPSLSWAFEYDIQYLSDIDVLKIYISFQNIHGTIVFLDTLYGINRYIVGDKEELQTTLANLLIQIYNRTMVYRDKQLPISLPLPTRRTR